MEADPGVCAVKGAGVRPVACWDCWFESLWGQG